MKSSSNYFPIKLGSAMECDSKSRRISGSVYL